MAECLLRDPGQGNDMHAEHVDVAIGVGTPVVEFSG